MRELLVSVEVGLSVVAVVIGVLLLRSFQEILQVERGFQSADIVSVTVGLLLTSTDFTPSNSSIMPSVISRW